MNDIKQSMITIGGYMIDKYMVIIDMIYYVIKYVDAQSKTEKPFIEHE